MITMPKLYLAGPLFSQAELDYNRNIKKLLSNFFKVYLPQEDGGLLVDMIAKGVNIEEATRKIFLIDMEAIESCDIFLIILDGRVVDEGAAFELGIAFAQGKLCYGLRTDPRQLLATGNNPMIETALKDVFNDPLNLIRWAKNFRYYFNTDEHLLSNM